VQPPALKNIISIQYMCICIYQHAVKTNKGSIIYYLQ
jgi:hypothetical protein